MSMRFDPVTGEKIQQDSEPQENQAGQSYFYQQPAPEQPPKKKKAGPILAVIAVLLVLAAGAVVWAVKSGLFSSNSAKVLAAITNTVRDTGDLTGAFRFGDILLSDESTLTVSTESPDFGMELQLLHGTPRK